MTVDNLTGRAVRGNRFPSCDLVPQFARVLQIPDDIQQRLLLVA